MLAFLRIEIDFPNVGPIGDFGKIPTEHVSGFKSTTGSGDKGAVICKNIRFAFQINNNIIHIDQEQQRSQPTALRLHHLDQCCP